MPKRNYYKGKRTYRKKRYNRPSRLQTVRKLAGQPAESMVDRIARYGGAIGKVASTVAGIASLINVETKNYDSSFNSTISSSGTGQSFVDIGQGNADNQRNGEKVVSKDLNINYDLTCNSSATNTTVGLAIVMDKKPEVGASNWATVFSANDPNAMLNKDNTDRYIILKRLTIPLSSITNSHASGKIYLNLKRIHIEWNSSTSTDFEKNNIFMLMISNEATNTPTLKYYARYNFYDN